MLYVVTVLLEYFTDCSISILILYTICRETLVPLKVNLANDHEFAKFSPYKYFASEENSKPSLKLKDFLLNQGLLGQVSN